MEALGAYGSDSEPEGAVAVPSVRGLAPSGGPAADTLSVSAPEAGLPLHGEVDVGSLRDARGLVGRDFDNPLFLQRHLRELGIDEHGSNLQSCDS